MAQSMADSGHLKRCPMCKLPVTSALYFGACDEDCAGKAVNSFEAMREALESARNWAILKNNMDCVSWLEDVESALKLAEGQKQ